jgi:sulfur relay (sulfurtransferase) DsrC/TusE family protein
MTQKFTPEDLVQYLYKETTHEQNIAIENAMAADWTLREKFEVIKKAHARLEKFKISPRVETVLNVLKYGTPKTVSHT